MEGQSKVDAVEAIVNVLIYLVISFSLFAMIVFVAFPKYLPLEKIVSILIFVLVLFVIFGLAEIYLYRLVDWFYGREPTWETASWGYLLVYAIATSLQNVGILLALFLGKKYFDTQLDLKTAEATKRENELRILKAQIDPHFLFNNLNSVDTLIDSNPQLAREYIQKLSKLYRYLLKTRDDVVVSLEEELAFAQNYIFLLENRFGDAFVFKVENGANFFNKLIPPGALQTVLENVIKHNSATSDEPVITTISINENEVLISNNIQSAGISDDAGGSGLKNLQSRFRLLGDKKIKIESTDFFKVTIPLINQIYE